MKTAVSGYADGPAMKEHEGNRPATVCMLAGGRRANTVPVIKTMIRFHHVQDRERRRSKPQGDTTMGTASALAITVLFTLALAFEAFIFVGMPWQLMVIVILCIAFLILLALASAFVITRAENAHERHQYGNLVFIAVKRRRLPHHEISLAIACKRERYLYMGTLHGRYMRREIKSAGPVGKSKIRELIGIISDAVYADGLVIDTRYGKDCMAVSCMGVDDVKEDVIPVLGSNLDSTM